MKMIYNGIDLASLGDLQITQRMAQAEPAEAPQRQKVTLRMELHLNEQNYRDNQGLVDQLVSALKTQQAVLDWQDESGAQFVNRTVWAMESAQTNPSDGVWGTYWMSVGFSFCYYEHDIVSNCLKASVQRASLGAKALDLGAVEAWAESYEATMFDTLKKGRKMVEGVVTASGRFQGDTTAPLTGATGRPAVLQSLEQAMLAEIQAESEVQLKYGSFAQNVRVRSFKANVNQPLNYIEWTASFQFIRYPDLNDYNICEFRFGSRVNRPEGIVHLTLNGTISAPSAAAAGGKLDDLKANFIPKGYVQLVNDIEQKQASGGDGAIFIEISFSLEWRDTTTLAAGWRRTAANTPMIDLGTVEQWRERYGADLVSQLRDQRRHAAGVVSASGKWFLPDEVSLADKQTQLMATRAAMMAELQKGGSGTLTYGPFNQGGVRIEDFTAEVDRLQTFIGWTLTAHWTRFPNESDYTLCEFKVATRENKIDGTVTRSLSGKIGAQSAAVARAKLAALGAALAPAGYVMIADDTEESIAEMDSQSVADPGNTFIELTFTREWQLTAGSLLRWDLRISDADDLKTGFVRSSYSGSVQASAPNLATAFTTAAAQAAALGANKYPFLIQSTLTQTQRQFLTTGGLVFVTVDFNYEYQRKGTRTFIEVTSMLSADTFGNDTEQVSGYVAAPTLAAALTSYHLNVRNIALYQGALLLNERTPTRSAQLIDGGASEDDRFVFSFTVFRPKTATTCQFALEPTTNFVTLDVTTQVRGTVYAADEVTAGAFVDNLLSTLALAGVQVLSQRSPRFDEGPTVDGVTLQLFKSLEFTETFVGKLTGQAGVLESEITSDIQYSGNRWIEREIPDGVSVMQNCGTASGRRTVTVNCKAVDEASVQQYIRKVRALFITGPYELPPRVNLNYIFLPLSEGVATGTGANVKIFIGQAVFVEVLPDFGFS